MAEPQPEPTPPTPQQQSQSANPAPSNFPGDSATTNPAEIAALSNAASKPQVSSPDSNSSAAPSTSTSAAPASASPAATSKTNSTAAKVKIDAKDVEFLVKELEVSKAKAMELLRGAEGERGRAVRGFVVGVGV